uniref:O-methyltransferase C-terminal domain-containing protein n=1 Tax=Ananas comosus var. bracteatus TaxID=296719 RepID=A0A6V7QG49_ANACO|nr:unnamed protein product [Ananas comosus var. bracteatus]
MAREHNVSDLESQIRAWQATTALVYTMSLHCAVELGIPDIVNEAPATPLRVSRIAAALRSTGPPQMPLCSTASCASSHTRASSPSTPPEVGVPGEPVARPCGESGAASSRQQTWKQDLWAITAAEPEYSAAFNAAMVGMSSIAMRAVTAVYKSGFKEIRTLVDVGGGTGAVLKAITELCPSVRGINFDLPHVVAAAPECPRVEHVGGSMFDGIPAGDAIFMKLVLHCFDDKDCLRILKNCQKVIQQKSGKLIIVEAVLGTDKDDSLEDMKKTFDMMMLAYTGGKERTEAEWRKLLHSGGFPRCNIIRLPSFHSIIEAFTQ